MNGEKIAHQRKSASTVGGLKLFFAALVAACLVGAGAQAASQERHPPKPPEKHKPATALAVKDPDTTSSIQENGEGNCARARQRFFVKGEGWIVRRVTTCY